MGATNQLKSANILATNEFERTRATLSLYNNVTITPDQQRDLDGFNSSYQSTNVPDSNLLIISNPLRDLRTANHSNGGDRNEYALGGLDQITSSYWDSKEKVYKPVSHGIYATPIYDPTVESGYRLESNASVQYYGTPTGTDRLGETATNAGVWMDNKQTGVDKNNNPIYSYNPGHKINYSDPIPNIMGGNSTSVNELIDSFRASTSLGDSNQSPHSSYYCTGSFCGYGGFENKRRLLPEQHNK